MNEATTKDIIAIDKSLNPSKTDASVLLTPSVFIACKMTVPTLFNNIAKIK
ncbi:hypothetical protein PAGA_b0354 [Pseudoalteromonas agarivorans DSM 14585]|uniref:Uncharacterized protein n=1 Tax=Pseudoalteromonas agarivorans DSM 14585 TaxID=1312369 RepID=A0ACA8E229_9GAMM|nr:hypothetical protein PAGA_b0354 [Pseudoalteromonas agarivorans DSM 14585]